MNTTKDGVLGKQVGYPDHYCPDILIAIPRSINRSIYGITSKEPIMYGFDCWNTYECSFLLDNGLPICGIAKIVYTCQSPSIVESKSLKLYLASFIMEKMGKNIASAISKFVTIVKDDLSKLLECQVEMKFFTLNDYNNCNKFDFNDYKLIESDEDIENLNIIKYTEDPSILTVNLEAKQTIKYRSELLKSNCKITHQPDWGSVFIHLSAKTTPSKSSLLQYIVSLRGENHFHEEICEMIFKRLTDIFTPDKLMVCCMYTRRGGIDICPARANSKDLLPIFLGDASIISSRTFRQ